MINLRIHVLFLYNTTLVVILQSHDVTSYEIEFRVSFQCSQSSQLVANIHCLGYS